jgi:hypothetical protein
MPSARQRADRCDRCDAFGVRRGCSRLGVRLAYRAWSLHAPANDFENATTWGISARIGIEDWFPVAHADGANGPIAQSVRAPGS